MLLLLKKFTVILIFLISFNYVFSDGISLIENNKITGKIFYDISDIPENTSENYYIGYFFEPEKTDGELCYLAIGAVRNYDLIQKFFFELGTFYKNLGIDFVIFGNLSTINKNSGDYLDYLGKSPYIISEIHYRMIRGFESAGIIPVINVSQDDDKTTVDSLLSKAGTFYSYSEKLDNVNLRADNKNVYVKNKMIFKLNFKTEKLSYEESLYNIYENSIILSGYISDDTKIMYKEIDYSDRKRVIYFSKKVESVALEVYNGTKKSTGSKNW